AALVVGDAGGQKVLLEKHIERVAIWHAAQYISISRLLHQPQGQLRVMTDETQVAPAENTAAKGAVHAVARDIGGQFFREPSSLPPDRRLKLLWLVGLSGNRERLRILRQHLAAEETIGQRFPDEDVAVDVDEWLLL